MKKFIQYYCSTDKSKPRYSTEIHANAIEGIRPNEFYQNKTRFFRKYYIMNQKLNLLDRILRTYVNKQGDILSVGSGHCVNEYRIESFGYYSKINKQITIIPYDKVYMCCIQIEKNSKYPGIFVESF